MELVGEIEWGGREKERGARMCYRDTAAAAHAVYALFKSQDHTREEQ